ncbi:hypothetical protein SAY87_015879 [Trapa incisa]|uniref:Metallothionein-like protein n=1 Tax=Trapa incisa TaxID=236973 RepID=A0AAN7L0D0_9MYRT|nr:hypothetical protein SAY87_015879 [Trapa incisa]
MVPPLHTWEDLSGDMAAVSGGGAELITVPPDFVLAVECLPKNPLSSKTFEIPKNATRSSSTTVRVTEARTIPVSMARDPLTREILRTKLQTHMTSLAGYRGLTMDSRGCGRNPSLGLSEAAATTTSVKAIVSGVAPIKMHKEDAPEVSTEGGHGCRCGSSCSCDPCNC